MLAGTPAAAGTSYLLSEDCDGSGQPSGWTSYTSEETTGGVDWDYTTSPAPLVGTQSLYLTSDGFRAEYKTFADTSPCYLYWQCNIKTMGSTDSDFLHIDNAAATSILIVRRDAVTGYVKISDALDGGKTSSTPISVGTTYHYWLEYTTGGTVNLFVSANATKPASPAITYTTSATVGCGMMVGVASWGSEIILDKLRASATAIGSSPD